MPRSLPVAIENRSRIGGAPQAPCGPHDVNRFCNCTKLASVVCNSMFFLVHPALLLLLLAALAEQHHPVLAHETIFEAVPSSAHLARKPRQRVGRSSARWVLGRLLVWCDPPARARSQAVPPQSEAAYGCMLSIAAAAVVRWVHACRCRRMGRCNHPPRGGWAAHARVVPQAGQGRVLTPLPRTHVRVATRTRTRTLRAAQATKESLEEIVDKRRGQQDELQELEAQVPMAALVAFGTRMRCTTHSDSREPPRRTAAATANRGG